jgi:uncharacterized protein
VDRILVEILGLSTGSESGGAYALILKEADGSRRLPIIIGAFEAQAIALEIEGIRPPRPLTHDLLKNVIDALGSTVADVTITELREGTFYAQISLDNAAVERIDSRPSDAIALAVRCNVSIFVAEDVMREAAFIPEDEVETDDKLAASPAKSQSREQRMASLQTRLQEAIQREDYEEAARIRDDIRQLQQGD